MGVASRAPFKGQWVSLARDEPSRRWRTFAVCFGEPNLADFDLHATADGKGKLEGESVTRLAPHAGTRQRGRNAPRVACGGGIHSRRATALDAHDGALQVLSHVPLAVDALVVAAESAQLTRLRSDYVSGASASRLETWRGLTRRAERWATACAPAVAVALLAG